MTKNELIDAYNANADEFLKITNTIIGLLEKGIENLNSEESEMYIKCVCKGRELHEKSNELRNSIIKILRSE